MKKIYTVLWLACFAAIVAAAEPLTVAENGRSDYRIVYADSAPNQKLNQWMRNSANTLQKILKTASGATLPVFAERDASAAAPTIWIGKVRSLHAQEPVRRWEHHIAVRGKDIYLWGMDRQGNVTASAAPYRDCILGSHKAVLEFAEKFTGAVWTVSPDIKDSVPRQNKVSVPADFRYDGIPVTEYCISRGKSLDYDLGNNFFSAPWNHTFGGHSHVAAIPASLAKKHPEYFRMNELKKRFCYIPRPQYCFSNPEVRELIYRNVLDSLDKGYEQTQLSQSDSFRACLCDACVKRRGKWSAGEMLWRMHRDMALRLMKDRPGKKVVILAYGPTLLPPQSFKEFPPNCIVELAPAVINMDQDGNDVWSKWRSYKVEKVAYIYNWGYYNFSGFTPNYDLQFHIRQARLFQRDKIRGIYRCGFGELPGLEGAVYYIWGKLLANPEADPDTLMKKYCRIAYRAAAPEMEKFLRELDRAIASQAPELSDWNRDINPGRRQFLRYDIRLAAKRYPEPVLKKLEQLLRAAEVKADTALLRLARLEFDYLKLTAQSAAVFLEAVGSGSAHDADKLLNAVERRQKFIDELYRGGKSALVFDGISAFGGAKRELLRQGGRLCCVLNAPYHWDLAALRRLNILPFGRTIKADGRDTQYLVPQAIDDKSSETTTFRHRAKISCRRDGTLLKIKLTTENFPANELKLYRIHIKIGPDRASRRLFQTPFRSGQTTVHIPSGVVSDPHVFGRWDKWRADTNPHGSIRVPAPGETGETSAEIAIPLSVWQGTSGAAEKNWLFNLSLRSRKNELKGSLVWESSLMQQDWNQSFEREGHIIF